MSGTNGDRTQARVGVVGGPSEGNLALVAGLRSLGVKSRLMGVPEALAVLDAGDTALVRLDVLPTLDGVEPGLELLPQLATRGVRVLNRPGALLRAHDKLRTAKRLESAGLPHPATQALLEVEDVVSLEVPVVLKPRFGSWGSDVWRCDDRQTLRLRAGDMRARAWFHSHGVLAQELLPSAGHDLRLLVAAGKVIGAARRNAAPGEWRTNVSVGGNLEPVRPPSGAVLLALAAADALGTDLVGVDLLPARNGFTILELNGAVDFSAAYSLPARDVYADLAAALELPFAVRASRSAVLQGSAA